ncbi:MAG: hypothetical protein ACT4PE_08540 [Candidatus Eiseniibacteriota bacterium]
MSVLKALRAFLVAALVVCAFAFTMYNASTRVEFVRLPFLSDRNGVLLVELMLYPLLLGLAAGFSFALVMLLEAQTALRSERRTRQKVQTELTALRNLPIEDTDDEPGRAGAVS